MLALFIVILTVVICCFLHHHALNRVAHFAFSPRFQLTHHILFVVMALLFMHVCEILLFSADMALIQIVWKTGLFIGDRPLDWLDYIQLSTETFTTMGFSDLHPNGDMRILTSIESLVGIILITWSGSFIFYAIQRLWDRKSEEMR